MTELIQYRMLYVFALKRETERWNEISMELKDMMLLLLPASSVGFSSALGISA